MKTVKELGLTRVVTLHRNVNDCWCLVISQATGKKYDLIRSELKGFMSSDYSLRRHIATQYLLRYGFSEITFKKLITVREVMLTTTQPIIIASYDRRRSMHHLAYAENHVLYTTSDTDECFYDPAFYGYIHVENNQSSIRQQ